MKPTKAHLIKIRKRPRKKAAVPLSFCLRAKKARVFWGPIIIVRPIRKSICGGGVSGCWLEGKGGEEGETDVAHCEPGGEQVSRGIERREIRTYIALSKNSRTPPIRKNPPVKKQKD